MVKYFREKVPIGELYDHKTDPYKNNNVAGDRPDIFKKLMPLWEKGNTGFYGNVIGILMITWKKELLIYPNPIQRLIY